MTDFTYSLQKSLLDHYLALSTYTAPTTRYLSLHLADPTKSGSISDEVSTSGTAYARQSIDSNMSAAGATDGTSVNVTAITFPVITADYGGPITHIGVLDAVSAGTMGLFAALSESQVKNVGQSFQLAPSQLSLRFD